VRSCENGHAIFPGEEFCDRCGARARPRFTPEPPDPSQPAAQGGDGLADQQSDDPVTEYSSAPLTEYQAEYTSGSFAEYIAAMEAESDIPVYSPDPLAGEAEPSVYHDDAEVAGDTPVSGFQAMPGAPLAVPLASSQAVPEAAAQESPAPPAETSARPLDEDDRPSDDDQPSDDGGPPVAVGPATPPESPADVSYKRPGRARLLAAVAALAILGVTGVTGVLMVIHQRSGPSARPPLTTASSLTGTGSRAGSASATPAKSPAATEGLARWTAPVPVAPQTLQGSERVTGLACSTKAVCYAADSGGGVLSLHSAGDWPVAAADPNGGLVAISCASAKFCVALDTSGYSIALSQGSWGSPVLVGTGPGTLTSVSCTSANFCMAVDTIGIGFRYSGPAGDWIQLTVDPGGHALNSVSCASPTHCVAVSSTGDLFTYNGTSWSAANPVDSGHDLVSVSCPNVVFCMAVDPTGLAAQFASGQWILIPIQPGAVAVSCPAQGTCLASFKSGAVSTFANGGWSRPTVVDPGASLTHLSCFAVNSCTAIDRHDNVLFYARTASG
jgi:hypothetical protein